jgi:hypothetical protein
MNKLIQISAILAASAILSACGPDKVSFDTLETARSQGKANAEWNAQGFRASAPQYANTAITSQTDSTMSAECPQGDGWASVKLINKDNPGQKIGLKCSTVSGSVGCLTDDDFAKKSYAGDDGRCQDQTKVPFPIPKIAK